MDSPAHRALALRAARESMVLLKNNGLLPLQKTVKRIAVIGPLADQVPVLLGNYNGEPSRAVTALDGIKAAFPGAEVTYVPGTNFLRLLDLAEPVRQLVRDGRISTGHAKILAGVDDILEQERLANLIVSQELSVRNLERMLEEGNAKSQAAHAPAATSAHLNDLERSIAAQIGMKVQIRSSAKKGRGRLVIHYATLDQFDELLGKLGVSVE